MRHGCVVAAWVIVLCAPFRHSVVAQDGPPSVSIQERLFCFRQVDLDREALKNGKIKIESVPEGIFWFGVFTGTSRTSPLVLTNLPATHLPRNVFQTPVTPPEQVPVFVAVTDATEIDFEVGPGDVGLAAKVMLSFGPLRDLGDKKLAPFVQSVVPTLHRRVGRAQGFYRTRIGTDGASRDSSRTAIYALDRSLEFSILGFSLPTGGLGVSLRTDSIVLDLVADGLDEANEETVGLALCTNDDDDNVNRRADSGEHPANEGIEFEDDLLRLAIPAMTDDPTISAQATFVVPGKLGLWAQANKAGDPVERVPNMQAPFEVFVEGRAASASLRDAVLHLDARPADSPGREAPDDCRDSIAFTVFQITGPQFVPEFSRHDYSAPGLGEGGEISVQSDTGDANAEDTGSNVTIRWGEGPQIGHVILTAHELECRRDVDMIQVLVTAPPGGHITAQAEERDLLRLSLNRTHTLKIRGERIGNRTGEVDVATGQEGAARGLAAAAHLELLGPHEHRGVVRIEVSFAQDVRPDPDYGIYYPVEDESKEEGQRALVRLVRSLMARFAPSEEERKTDPPQEFARDVRTRPDRTGEADSGHETIYSPHILASKFTPASRERRGRNISFEDTPKLGFPAGITGVQPAYDNPPLLRRFQMTLSFRLAVVARVAGDEALKAKLTPRAWLAWELRVNQAENSDFAQNDLTEGNVGSSGTRAKLTDDSHVHVTQGADGWLAVEGVLPVEDLVVEGDSANNEFKKFIFFLDDLDANRAFRW